MLYETKNPHGGDIYGDKICLDFSANTNPFGTPEEIRAAIRDSLSNLDRYPDPYCRKLVSSIAEFENVPGDFILCGNGAADLIYAFCRAAAPQKAAELAPTFSEYSLGLTQSGSKISRYYLKKDNGFRLNDDFLKFLINTQPDALFLCNPNNPTGSLVPDELMDQIAALTKRMNCRLFVDECFLDLTEHGRSMKGYLKENPHIFILKAFTKSYGLAGIRLGYCLCSDKKLLTAMSQDSQPWNISGPAQAAGVAALDQQDFLKKTRSLISEQRKWLAGQLEQLGFWVKPSEVNYILFQGPENLHKSLMKQQISIRNCNNYPGLGSGWYRIAVRLPEENRILVDAIRNLLGKV